VTLSGALRIADMEAVVLARIIWNPFGALILGTLALAVGIATLTGVNVACKDTTTALSAGQSCTSRTGKTVSFTEWQSEQRFSTIFLLALGGLLVIGGAYFLSRRRKRRAATAAAKA